MPSQKKIFTVENLTQKFKEAKALILADYRGLSVADLSELRQKVKGSGGQLEVVKNRLLLIAANQAKVKLEDQALTGPTLALWAFEDEIAPLKTLDAFAQKNGLPVLKLGLFNKEILPLEKVKRLAKIESPEQLKAQLVGFLAAPLAGLNQTLSWNLKKLIWILKSQAKGGENHA